MNYPDLPQKTHLLVTEAARFLDVSQKTVRRWHHEGLIRGTRLSGSLSINRKSLAVLFDPYECGEQDKGA
jgi:excisionase family DNA binding protein